MAYNYKTQSYLAYARGIDFANAVEVMENSNVYLMIPEIVNLTLCCELLIKAILIMEKQGIEGIKGHKLDELFSMLQPLTQGIIKSNASIFDWDSFIKKSSNAFIEWRYLHEKDEVKCISICNLQKFFYSLKAYYEKAYPLASLAED